MALPGVGAAASGGKSLLSGLRRAGAAAAGALGAGAPAGAGREPKRRGTAFLEARYHPFDATAPLEAEEPEAMKARTRSSFWQSPGAAAALSAGAAPAAPSG